MTFSPALMHASKNDRLPCFWSPEAEQDLLEIWEHMSSSASAPLADEALNEIHRRTTVLGLYPEYGKGRDDVRVGVRSTRVHRWVVFYRVKPDALEVVRVLDERRDVDTIFSDDA